MRGHPLHGETLQVDLHVSARSDDFIQVVLPDGSRTLFPVGWTDVAPSETTCGDAVRFTRDGLRKLVRVVEALSCR